MLIEPSTTVRLIQRCPLDKNYKHTYNFESKQKQAEYFQGLPGITLTKQSYQRYDAGVLTVQTTLKSVIGCNYLMFKNESYENKWFYAFITKTEYVNNITSKIYYTLDHLQSWWFDFDFLECFVEREHVDNDDIGANTVEEDVDLGPYVYEDTVEPKEGSTTLRDVDIVIAYNPSLLDIAKLVANEEEEKHFIRTEGIYNGIYQGVRFFVMPNLKENVGLLSKLMTAINMTNSGGIICAFMMPRLFIPTAEEDKFQMQNKRVIMELNRNITFDGWVPYNNKLFTAPYTSASLTNNRGDEQTFRFELAGTYKPSKITFFVEGIFCVNPAVIAYPSYYAGGSPTNHCVQIPSYPLCTWGSDGFTEWVSNNMFSSLVTTGMNTAATYLSPTLARSNKSTQKGALMRTEHDAVSNVISGTQSIFEAGQVRGSVQGDIAYSTEYGRNIWASVKRIKGEYAKKIDRYFSAYGYASHLVKVPNWNVREKWNYIKTVGCAIRPKNDGVPAESVEIICKACDNGLTIWNYPYTIGEYAEPNTIK